MKKNYPKTKTLSIKILFLCPSYITFWGDKGNPGLVIASSLGRRQSGAPSAELLRQGHLWALTKLQEMEEG